MDQEYRNREPDYSMDVLEPSYFEWLDLAGEFFKHDGSFSFGEERNSSVVRNGERYNEIEREYRQLEKLYEACPEFFAEPLMKLERDGEVVGFYLERLEGENLQDYLRNNEDLDENRRIMEKVEEAVEEIHREGLVHGDLANNGILMSDGGFKFFDPVGEPYKRDAEENMKSFDEGDLERLTNTAQQPYSRFVDW